MAVSFPKPPNSAQPEQTPPQSVPLRADDPTAALPDFKPEPSFLGRTLVRKKQLSNIPPSAWRAITEVAFRLPGLDCLFYLQLGHNFLSLTS